MTDKLENPGLYRTLSEPLESDTEFEQRGATFAKELRELRERLGIADVVYVVSSNVKRPDGGEKSLIMWGHCGDSSKVVGMLHHTIGHRIRQEVDTLLSMMPQPPQKPEDP